VQNAVYEIGKRHAFEPLRDWFKALYEVLFGQSQGPRFGSFAALFGCAETAALDPARAGRGFRERGMRALVCWASRARFSGVAGARRCTALALYTQGKYAQAIEAGVAENDAPGYAAAARAELADEMMRDTPCLECLKRAEVRTQGRRRRSEIGGGPCRCGAGARLRGAHHRQAWPRAFKRYAEQAKEHLDTALAVEPKIPGLWRPWAAGTSRSCAAAATTLAQLAL
jgi:hypothetical protein